MSENVLNRNREQTSVVGPEGRRCISNLDAELLVLIARYLDSLPGTEDVGQSLQSVLGQLGVLRPSLLWTGEQRESSFADVSRRLQNVSPTHLRDLIVQHFPPGTIPESFSHTRLSTAVNDNPASTLTENFAGVSKRKFEFPLLDDYQNSSGKAVRNACSQSLRKHLTRQLRLRHIKMVERCKRIASQFHQRLSELPEFPQLRLLDTSKIGVDKRTLGSIGPSWLPSVLYTVKYSRKTNTRRTAVNVPISYTLFTLKLEECVDCGKITQIDDGNEFKIVDGSTLESGLVSQLMSRTYKADQNQNAEMEVPPFRSSFQLQPYDILFSHNGNYLPQKTLNLEDGDILRVVRPANRLACFLQEDTSNPTSEQHSEQIKREVDWYDFLEYVLSKHDSSDGISLDPSLNTPSPPSTFDLPSIENGLQGKVVSKEFPSSMYGEQSKSLVTLLAKREVQGTFGTRGATNWHSCYRNNSTAGHAHGTGTIPPPPSYLFTRRLSPLGAVSGHMGQPAYCVAYDVHNDYVISGADDHLVKVWSATYGHLVATLRGMEGVLQDLSVDSTNRYVAAASEEQSSVIRIWSLQDWSSSAVLVGHTKMVNFLEFDRVFSNILISVSDDGTCRVWDIGGFYSTTHPNYKKRRSTDESENHAEETNGAATSGVNVQDYMDVDNDPEGRDAAAALQRELRQRRSNNRAASSTNEFFREAVERSLENNPCYVLNHKDDTVKKGKTLLRQGNVFGGDTETKVTALSVSPLGGVIATGTQNGVVRIYSLLSSASSQDACSRDWEMLHNVVRSSNRQSEQGYCVDERSRTRVFGYGHWSNHVLHKNKRSTGDQKWADYDSAQPSMAESQSSDKSPVLEDAVLSPELRLTCHGHTSTVNSLAFSNVGDRVASSGAKDGTVRVWTFSRHYGDYVCLILDARRGEYPSDYAELQSAFRTKDKPSIMWKIQRNMEEGCNIDDLRFGNGGGVVTDSKGEVIATGEGDCPQFWDAHSAYHSDSNVGFGFTGRMGKDSSRNARSAWWKQDVPVPEIDQIAWTKDDSRIISSQKIAIETKWEDEVESHFFTRLKVWSSDTGELLRIFTGHDGPVFVLEPSPIDPSIFLSGGQDGRLNVWDCNELRTQPLAKFEFHRLQQRSDNPSLVNNPNLRAPLLPKFGSTKCREIISPSVGRSFLGGAVVQEKNGAGTEPENRDFEVHVESMSSSLNANKYHACKDMLFSRELAGVLDIKWKNDGMSFVVTDVEGRVTWFGEGGVEWSLEHSEATALTTMEERLSCVARGNDLKATSQSAVSLYLTPFFQYFSLDYEPLMRDIYYNVIDRAHQVPPHLLLPEQNIGNEFFEDYPFIPAYDSSTDQRIVDENAFSVEVVRHTFEFYQRLKCDPIKFVCQFRPRHIDGGSKIITTERLARNIIDALKRADYLFGSHSQDATALRKEIKSLFYDRSSPFSDATLHIKASYGTSASRRLGRTAIRQQERRRTNPAQYRDDTSDDDETEVVGTGGISSNGPSGNHAQTGLGNSLAAGHDRQLPSDSGQRHPRTVYSNRYANLSYLQQLTRRARAFARSRSRGTRQLRESSSSMLMEEHIESSVRSNDHGYLELASDYDSDEGVPRQQPTAQARSRSSRRTSRPVHLLDSVNGDADEENSDDSEVSADTVDRAREDYTVRTYDFFNQDALAQLFSSIMTRDSYDLRVTACIRGLRVQGITHADEASGGSLLDKCQKSLIYSSLCYAAEALNSNSPGLTRLGFKPQRDEREAKSEVKEFRRRTRHCNEWLLRTRPTPCSYLPQLGDDVVYFPEGHAELLGVEYSCDDRRDSNPLSPTESTSRTPSTRAKRQRETKEITVHLKSEELGLDCELPGRVDNSMLRSKPSRRFPWQEWPSSWRYVRCRVAAINYVYCYQQDAAGEEPTRKRRKGRANDYVVILEVTLQVTHEPAVDSAGRVSWRSLARSQTSDSSSYFRQYVGPNGCLSIPDLEIRRCSGISPTSNDVLTTGVDSLDRVRFEGVNCLILNEDFEQGVNNMNKLQSGRSVEIPFIDVPSALDCCEEDVFGRSGGYDLIVVRRNQMGSNATSAATVGSSEEALFSVVLSPALRSRSSASASNASRQDVERPSSTSSTSEVLIQLAKNPALKGRLLCESIADSVEASASALVMRNVDALDHPKWNRQAEKEKGLMLDPQVRNDIWGAVSNYVATIQELKSSLGGNFETKALLPCPLSKVASHYPAVIANIDIADKTTSETRSELQLPKLWCSIPVTFQENGEVEYVSPWEISGLSDDSQANSRTSAPNDEGEPYPMEQWRSHSSMVSSQFSSSLSEEQRCKALKTILELKEVPAYESFVYDVSALKFPQYGKQIPVPMSLDRIARRLIRHYYRSLESLLNDVELIRLNCANFNEPESDIVNVAVACVQDFHDKFESMSLRETRSSRRSASQPSPQQEEPDVDMKENTEAIKAAATNTKLFSLSKKPLQKIAEALPSNLTQAFHKILDWVTEADVLSVFSEPVPDDFLDYHDDIKFPQDYTTMRSEIESGQYSTVQKFSAELQLVYANAIKFNEEGDKYWMLAARSFQYVSPVLQAAQEKFQTALSVDLPMIPSTLPVDIDQFIVEVPSDHEGTTAENGVAADESEPESENSSDDSFDVPDRPTRRGNRLRRRSQGNRSPARRGTANRRGRGRQRRSQVARSSSSGRRGNPRRSSRSRQAAANTNGGTRSSGRTRNTRRTRRTAVTESDSSDFDGEEESSDDDDNEIELELESDE